MELSLASPSHPSQYRPVDVCNLGLGRRGLYSKCRVVQLKKLPRKRPNRFVGPTNCGRSVVLSVSFSSGGKGVSCFGTLCCYQTNRE